MSSGFTVFGFEIGLGEVVFVSAGQRVVHGTVDQEHRSAGLNLYGRTRRDAKHLFGHDNRVGILCVKAV